MALVGMNAQGVSGGAVVDVPVSHHFAKNLYAKEVRIDSPGTRLVQHKHEYDHLSVLARGAVRLTLIDTGEIRDIEAPACLLIEAGRVHGIEAITPDVVWYCIHGVPEEFHGDESLIAKE